MGRQKSQGRKNTPQKNKEKKKKTWKTTPLYIQVRPNPFEQTRKKKTINCVLKTALWFRRYKAASFEFGKTKGKFSLKSKSHVLEYSFNDKEHQTEEVKKPPPIPSHSSVSLSSPYRVAES